MKYLLIIPDGIGDHSSDALGGKTPLAVSRIPNLNYFAKVGKVGTVRNIPDRLEPATHIAISSLLGYEPKRYLAGPGPLEAANMEIKLEKDEVAFRMNFITESDGVLADASAGQITSKEARALIAFLNKKLSSEFVRFFPGREHRHIAVIKDARGFQALSAKCLPPRQVVGKKIQNHLPKGAGEETIVKLIYDSKMLLSDHEINQVRIDLGENPANMIWLWGQGGTPSLPKFSERFNGLTGASISTVDLVKGFSRLIGLTVTELPVKRSGPDPDFDYRSEAKAMVDLFEEKDFVCVHLRACDVASRLGDLAQKVASLEAIDRYVIAAAREFYEKSKNVRVLIVPMHNTLYRTKSRTREPVPFIAAGKNVVPDGVELFNETTAGLSSLKFSDGWKLIDSFITSKDLN
ncbi:MAG: hypothetical protein A3J52_03690 [Omnitrophica bacterium RIFCSPHIGHO2_02_FULL_49_9]|nr:MAG: hypothetical protein A3J52_03690 [Omnitrophica bacterium RIFCSPHIGHO2_02_FULL_49_9]